jgi:hypothetical protein
MEWVNKLNSECENKEKNGWCEWTSKGIGIGTYAEYNREYYFRTKDTYCTNYIRGYCTDKHELCDNCFKNINNYIVIKSRLNIYDEIDYLKNKVSQLEEFITNKFPDFVNDL